MNSRPCLRFSMLFLGFWIQGKDYELGPLKNLHPALIKKLYVGPHTKTFFYSQHQHYFQQFDRWAVLSNNAAISVAGCEGLKCAGYSILASSPIHTSAGMGRGYALLFT